ncbi:inositol polyphosphate-5-phosphatase A isoform X2 [Arctopsyche grandis]|uniref:inositol polyphosphate-5-phosphatase A isoform X2 n=1 Tax=Arctopsyche grandis TaxID=121162 RepID=UPI00406D6EAB
MLKFKKMGAEKLPVLLITANVGSIFESPSIMLPMWVTEFLQTITKMEPKFIGLHMQEVGGKTYEKSMQYVQEFIQRLCDSPELRLFDKIRIYLDEDYSSAEKFTALGNVYFIHSSLNDVKIWDFLLQEWTLVEGKEIHTGNIEKAPTKEKAKFPQHFFPECKWSRKGFMRVRWMIRNTAFELVNIHLFHDASNMIAAEATPSVYCRSRRRALRHTLQHLHQDPRQPPFFIFGDFNFRLDTAGIVKKLTDNLKATRSHSTKSVENTKLQYRSQKDDRVILTVGKKEFTHVEHQKVFREPWMLKFDKELDAMKPHLYEFPIKFPPSYPFEENVELPTHYMKTRCPSWCDRILLSQTARLIINHLDGQKLMPKDPAESRRSIVEQMDGSHRSSGQNSSSESSPARSSSPIKYGNISPGRKVGCTDFDGLSVPGIAQSRKSIADPTNIVHAMNARVSETYDGSPTKRRLVRNQSEGSPKMGEHLDMRKMSTDGGNPSLRKRVEYGIIGDATCMGDHKPVYLRILLQSDKGTVRCCMQDDSNDYCYIAPPEIHSETCFRHPSAQNLSKCPSKECFEPLSLTSCRSRLASQISNDSGFKGLLSKDRPSSLVRLGTDPSFNHINANHEDASVKTLNSDNLDSSYIKLLKLNKNSQSLQKPFGNSLSECLNDSLTLSNDNIDHANNASIPNVQINITGADYSSYDGIIVNHIDTHLLYCPVIPQDPYTPESIESHSPYPELCTYEEIEKGNNVKINEDINSNMGPNLDSVYTDDSSVFFVNKSQSLDRSEYLSSKTKSVSPRQLKSRLENILKKSDSNTESDSCNDVESCSIENERLGNKINDMDESLDRCSKTSAKIKIKARSKCKCFDCKLC